MRCVLVFSTQVSVGATDLNLTERGESEILQGAVHAKRDQEEQTGGRVQESGFDKHGGYGQILP